MTKKLSQREAAKLQRQTRILKAARSLLNEGGLDLLSMKSLADRADVSLMTLYNLIGSKHAVLRALLEEDAREAEERLSADVPRSPVGALLAVVGEYTSFIRERPGYMRAIITAVASIDEDESDWREPQRLWWMRLTEAGKASGELRADLDSETFVLCLQDAIPGLLLAWARGEIDLETFDRRCRYLFTLMLLGAAQGPVAEQLCAGLKR